MTRRERCREAQRRYEQTEKGKAALRRYAKSKKGRATQKRYADRRVWLNRRDIAGIASTAEEKRAIQAHIQRRKRELIERLAANSDLENHPTHGVSAEASH